MYPLALMHTAGPSDVTLSCVTPWMGYLAVPKDIPNFQEDHMLVYLCYKQYVKCTHLHEWTQQSCAGSGYINTELCDPWVGYLTVTKDIP